MTSPGLVVLAGVISGLAIGGEGATAQTAVHQLIPSRDGEVAITSATQQTTDRSWHYTPARRAGDYVYASGVVVGRNAGEPNTPEMLKKQARLAFPRIRGLLNASGADFKDVVMTNSFHDWSAPEFGGDSMAQLEAIRSVKEEFMGEPDPARTAARTSGMIRPERIVGIQMIACVPQRQGAKRGDERGGFEKQDDRAAHLDRSDG
jgi:enamine deaminase RidA (YjgF/YER057c/UK114 family)